MKYLSVAVVAVVVGLACCSPGDGWNFFPHRFFGSPAPVVHIPRPRFVVRQPQPIVYNHHPVWPYHFDDDHFDRKKRSVEPETKVSASRQKRSPGFDFDDDFHPWFRPAVSRIVYSRPVVRTFAPQPTFVRPSPYFFGHGFYDDK
ncbi:hypothetical protein Pcinc_007494 [Petrolisthes cinctipes]|uniref:Uncharacterized protein n=1 Tax=Petrolisthes cinctipes TaxID=88211 RepID=A0AAE1GF67_PETCI|nr:hypothetical protein Pcinc_007494 [Petrolisthes cinctipes]